jgi:hypothetical protein
VEKLRAALKAVRDMKLIFLDLSNMPFYVLSREGVRYGKLQRQQPTPPDMESMYAHFAYWADVANAYEAVYLRLRSLDTMLSENPLSTELKDSIDKLTGEWASLREVWVKLDRRSPSPDQTWEYSPIEITPWIELLEAFESSPSRIFLPGGAFGIVEKNLRLLDKTILPLLSRMSDAHHEDPIFNVPNRREYRTIEHWDRVEFLDEGVSDFREASNTARELSASTRKIMLAITERWWHKAEVDQKPEVTESLNQTVDDLFRELISKKVAYEEKISYLQEIVKKYRGDSMLPEVWSESDVLIVQGCYAEINVQPRRAHKSRARGSRPTR